MPATPPSDTRDRILDAGEASMKRNGYNGFSYAHIAEAVDIRKASIHHHFPSKSDLAREAVERYIEATQAQLDRLDARKLDLNGALKGLTDIFQAALAGEGHNCLCASLAADWEGLPEPVQAAVQRYWKRVTDWLTRAIRAELPELKPARARSTALLVFSLYEGALLSARVTGNTALLRHAASASRTLVAAELSPSPAQA